RFMFNANFIGRIQINGSGEQYRSFIHVDKIASCIAGAIDDRYAAGLYNVVEHNLSINEVAAEIRGLYPQLDSIHVNYSLKLRDVRTALPCRIFDHVQLPERSFRDELVAFRDSFSF
ncbi:MAG: SDR family NAD-dependent epimerase/dehydratase, partial [Saprospiraceae bacterium]|nr:SDR family NAD-dependent epimerase/dehydratase [Saprospiraceae bacterium]